MQFDMEHKAAEAFAAAFYASLLDPSCPLDAALSSARHQLRALGNPPRAWINPVLFSRCQNSRVFSYLRQQLSPEDHAELQEITIVLDVARRHLKEAEDSLPAEWPGFRRFARKQIAEVEQCASRQAELVRRALRAGWQIAPEGMDVAVPIHLSLVDGMADLEAVRVTLTYPTDHLAFMSATTDPALFATVDHQATRGRVVLELLRPAAQWPAGQACVAHVTLRVASPLARMSLQTIDLREASLRTDGTTTQIKSIAGAILLNPAPPGFLTGM
jgi:hypothetical protein